MTTQADGVDVHNIVWTNLVEVSSVIMLSGGGADIYLLDGDGDELNLELEEDAAKALRNELMELYPPEDDEEEEDPDIEIPVPTTVESGTNGQGQ